MSTVCSNNMCAGCMLCTEICPKAAIKVIDCLDAYNAVIDSNLCVNCNMCHKLCPQNNPPKIEKPQFCLEGWAVEEEIRRTSSSGGFAAAIEKEFVRNGGIVYSCSFKGGTFRFTVAEHEDEIKNFAGSKYIKSSPEKIYKEIASKIKQKTNILFVGLPCQVAALKNYVGESNYLYTIDLICHGSPSPHILELFLKDYGIKLKDIDSISFRKKNRFSLNSEFTFSVPIVGDYYSMTFLDGTSYTANCYECQYAREERVSDVTLGDSWGSTLPEDEKSKGISLALVQSEKGMKILKEANLQLFEADLARAVAFNSQLRKPSISPKHRIKFFRELKKGIKFRNVIFLCYPVRYLKDQIKTLFYNFMEGKCK